MSNTPSAAETLLLEYLILSREQNTVPSAGHEAGFVKLIEMFNVPEVAGSLESSSQDTRKNIDAINESNDSFFIIFILIPFYCSEV